MFKNMLTPSCVTGRKFAQEGHLFLEDLANRYLKRAKALVLILVLENVIIFTREYFG
jgi:hypothetical protein